MEEAATTTSVMRRGRLPRSGTKQEQRQRGPRGTGCGREVKRRRGTEADKGGCNGRGKRKTPCGLVAQRVPESCQALPAHSLDPPTEQSSKDCNTLGSEAAATELGGPDSDACMNALIQAGGTCCCLLLLAVQASINSQLCEVRDKGTNWLLNLIAFDLRAWNLSGF